MQNSLTTERRVDIDYRVTSIKGSALLLSYSPLPSSKISKSGQKTGDVRRKSMIVDASSRFRENPKFKYNVQVLIPTLKWDRKDAIDRAEIASESNSTHLLI